MRMRAQFDAYMYEELSSDQPSLRATLRPIFSDNCFLFAVQAVENSISRSGARIVRAAGIVVHDGTSSSGSRVTMSKIFSNGWEPSSPTKSFGAHNSSPGCLNTPQQNGPLSNSHQSIRRSISADKRIRVPLSAPASLTVPGRWRRSSTSCVLFATRAQHIDQKK